MRKHCRDVDTHNLQVIDDEDDEDTEVLLVSQSSAREFENELISFIPPPSQNSRDFESELLSFNPPPTLNSNAQTDPDPSASAEISEDNIYYCQVCDRYFDSLGSYHLVRACPNDLIALLK